MLRLLNKAMRRFGLQVVIYPACAHCGMAVTREAHSSTGFTHVGKWQGIRCPGLLCGATVRES